MELNHQEKEFIYVLKLSTREEHVLKTPRNLDSLVEYINFFSTLKIEEDKKENFVLFTKSIISIRPVNEGYLGSKTTVWRIKE